MSCGVLSLSLRRYKSRCRSSELYLCEYRMSPQESLDLGPKLLQKTSESKSILLVSVGPADSSEEHHAWSLGQQWAGLGERWTPFPDFWAHECGLEKTLPRKQTRLFCSFHSTAICLRQVRNWEELNFPALRNKERAGLWGSGLFGWSSPGARQAGEQSIVRGARPLCLRPAWLGEWAAAWQAQRFSTAN